MGAKAFLIHPSHQGVCWRHDTEDLRVTSGDLHGSRPTGRVSDPISESEMGAMFMQELENGIVPEARDE